MAGENEVGRILKEMLSERPFSLREILQRLASYDQNKVTRTLWGMEKRGLLKIELDGGEGLSERTYSLPNYQPPRKKQHSKQEEKIEKYIEGESLAVRTDIAFYHYLDNREILRKFGESFEAELSVVPTDWHGEETEEYKMFSYSAGLNYIFSRNGKRLAVLHYKRLYPHPAITSVEVSKEFYKDLNEGSKSIIDDLKNMKVKLPT